MAICRGRSVVRAVEKPLVRVCVAEDAVDAAVFERELVVIADEAAVICAVHFYSRTVSVGAVEMQSGRGRRRERGQCFQILSGDLARMRAEHASVMQLEAALRWVIVFVG